MDAGETTEPSSSTIRSPNADATVSSSTQTLFGSDSATPDGQERIDHGPGIYAIPVLPLVGEMTGFPAGNLVPIKYNVPIGPSGSDGGVNGEGQQEMRQQQEQQGQVVVRRFHFAIQIDLMLIFKLAAVVILFNQEGSRQRLFLLILFASIVYLYQTGAFAPLVRWLRLAGGGPPLLHAPPRRQENPPHHAAREEDHANDLPPEDNPAGAIGQEGPVVNNEENEGEGGGRNGVDWHGIAREVKMLVISFLASLFPGFHLHND